MLVGGRHATLKEIAALIGDDDEADAFVDLLVRLKFVRVDAGEVTALPKVDGGAQAADIAELEEYLLGQTGGKSLERIRGILNGESTIDVGGQGSGGVAKVDVDPEVVKRFTKGFIDVNEIIESQRKRGLGK